MIINNNKLFHIFKWFRTTQNHRYQMKCEKDIAKGYNVQY